ncbi:chemotaxis response regulator protein-glutamate methylesterase [Bacillus sp. FJAT-49736]|uniref:protein-glutamate methylesterase/protein-glutamine glutaminase n=1 Tax=Bacillus sp. FJAT-49736 TaxID=2833582 RepID=UPI001BC9440E|nr:chemotaxis response regulator protein-glutamate methylesterase [Bacillus sp. FJAT-49736]MBS4172537.1 chemotaxis response regulator protein-glutamate methylesterase [Bacillus sp. FJAT-49736]
MEKIRVLVVDDSAFMRKLISDILQSDSNIEVIGTSRNGLDAIEKVKKWKPNVVTLDIEMPIMDGLEALQRIMKENPTPVIMLSSTTKLGAENTMTAMQYGAIDFVTKPSGSISLDLEKVKEDLIQKVKSARLVNIQKLRFSAEVKKVPKLAIKNDFDSIKRKTSDWNKEKSKLVCIGISTGGPRALQQLLTSLPASLNAPVVIVQHMPAGFTKSLANRLNALSQIHVKEAEDGELLRMGTAYIAPGDYHLQVKQLGTNIVISLNQSPPLNGHRPSVDIMFQSISHLSNYDKIAVIMTGMGSDGAQGLIELKKKGNVKAIAESKNSCIVFGMPKAAIATNLVDDVEDLENISKTIMNYLS